MLSNANFLAKFRFDTAENEPAKNLQNLNFANFCKTCPASSPATVVSFGGATMNAFFENAFNKIFENFANFWRARSRLYQNEILQENNTKYAFDSIFQALQDLHPFAPLQSQKFRKKIGLKKQQFS